MTDLRLLRQLTPARVALGRAGDSLPTTELLSFQLAHAQARDAVHAELDSASLALELQQRALEAVVVASAARDRATYLRRPDLGRKLAEESRNRLSKHENPPDAVFVLADGLSALAVHRHAVALLDALLPQLSAPDWRIGPIVIVQQGRVAIGDEIGELLRASLAVVLIGERPGLTSPDSLGVYLTWQPKPGRTDAERNCISNIRAEGLSYADAADRLRLLMSESRSRKLSGVWLTAFEAEQLKHLPAG